MNNTSLNILYFSPSNSIGGAEFSLLGIVSEARKHGHKPYVVLPPAKGGNTSYTDLLRPHCEEIFIVRPMPVHVRPGMSWFIKIINYFYNCFLTGWHIVPVYKLWKIIKDKKIDLVHTNTVVSIEPAIAARLSGKPHVWHIREVTGDHPRSIIRLPLQRHPHLFRFLIDRLTTAIVANSKATAEAAAKYFPERKMQVIYNSLSDSWFVYPARKRLQPPYVVGTLANVTAKWKNHKFVISTARAMKEQFSEARVIFNIYGNLPSDDDPYLSELKEMITRFGLSETVIFKGRQERNEIYKEIDVLLHPASKESFGRIFIESMGKGIPVVAVKGGGADELIEDSVTGFTVPSDQPTEAAQKIAGLIHDSDLRSGITQRGFDFASSRFRSSEMWEELTGVYRKCLA